MKKQKGFSFMEVMITMFVVSVGLVTIIQFFGKGFINSALDRDRIVAAGLAQEGVEIVKNIRDNSLAIPGNFGFENFGPLIQNGNHDNQCGLDYTDRFFYNSGGNRNCFSDNSIAEQKFSLNLGATGFLSGVTSTKWARVIYIFYNNNGASPPYSDDSADVVSMVWWSGSSVPHASMPSGVDQTQATINANLSNCTAASKCVYAKMHLDAWKP